MVKEWEYWTCGQVRSSITSGGHARLVMIDNTDNLKVAQTMLLVNKCISLNA